MVALERRGRDTADTDARSRGRPEYARLDEGGGGEARGALLQARRRLPAAGLAGGPMAADCPLRGLRQARDQRRPGLRLLHGAASREPRRTQCRVPGPHGAESWRQGPRLLLLQRRHSARQR
jgi:hypothetical protein